MRCAVVGAAVGLDLDDPRLAPAGLVVANQACAEQDPSDVGRLTRELGPLDEAQAGAPL
jgi:hypothetical protein